MIYQSIGQSVWSMLKREFVYGRLSPLWIVPTLAVVASVLSRNTTNDQKKE